MAEDYSVISNRAGALAHAVLYDLNDGESWIRSLSLHERSVFCASFAFSLFRLLGDECITTFSTIVFDGMEITSATNLREQKDIARYLRSAANAYDPEPKAGAN